MLKNTFVLTLFCTSLLLLLAAGFIVFTGLIGETGSFVISLDEEGLVDLSGSTQRIVSILGVVGAMVCMNFFLAYILYYRERLLAYILASASTVVSLVGLVFALFIVSVN